MALKRTIVRASQKYLVNPPVRLLAHPAVRLFGTDLLAIRIDFDQDEEADQGEAVNAELPPT